MKSTTTKHKKCECFQNHNQTSPKPWGTNEHIIMIREKNTQPTPPHTKKQHECNPNHDQTGKKKKKNWCKWSKRRGGIHPCSTCVFWLTESYTNYMGQGDHTLQLQKQRNRGETLVAWSQQSQNQADKNQRNMNHSWHYQRKCTRVTSEQFASQFILGAHL